MHSIYSTINNDKYMFRVSQSLTLPRISIAQRNKQTNILEFKKAMKSNPCVVTSSALSPDEAKWIALKKIRYLDAEGRERLWECAERKTRNFAGVDAVAILAIIRSKTNAFPLSTVLIEQYRPPIDKFVIELPAGKHLFQVSRIYRVDEFYGQGLIDAGESPEQAAIRELEEETGYKASNILETSSLLVSDPGMTNANMKLVTLEVLLDNELETPKAHLEAGEFIDKRIIELSKLYFELREYQKKGFITDARLSHLAFGIEIARRVQEGDI